MDLLLGIGILLGGIAVGTVCGIGFAKLHILKINKKLVKNLAEVMTGERENKCAIEGKVIHVTRFVVRNDKDEDEVIEFKDGKVTKKIVKDLKVPTPDLKNVIPVKDVPKVKKVKKTKKKKKK